MSGSAGCGDREQGGGDPWSLEFEDIYALQVLVREDETDVAELNVVRTDGRRLHVITQGGGRQTVHEARRLSAQLAVPVWEAPVPPPKVLTLAEITGRNEREIAERRAGNEGLVRDYFLSLPGALMVLANVGPLVEVLLGRWTVLGVLTLYWWEIVVAGAFNVLRLAALPSGSWANVKTLSIIFFIVHYGGFAALEGWVVLGLFDREASGEGPVLDLGPLLDAPTSSHLGLWVVLFAVAQGVSFFRDYLGRREYVRVDPSKLLTGTYSRIAVLHAALMAAIIAAPPLDAPEATLALLVVLMVVAEVLAHVVEKTEMSPGAGVEP